MTQRIEDQELRDVYMHADLLYDEIEVQQALQRMAFAISGDLSEARPVVMPVMNGGMIIAGQLLTQLNFPLEVDYLHATRYRNNTSGTSLEWKAFPTTDVKDRLILVIDDIYDEGHTLASIVEYLYKAGAAQVRIAVLLNKIHTRKIQPPLTLDYIGFDIQDSYVFGYGMDYKGFWRNAPGIFAVRDKP